MAFRIFDPDTKTRSAEAKALGLDDWTAVLRHTVMRGVNVRLLLTDFEPVMAHDLHAGSWNSFHTLRAMAETLPPDRLEDFEMMVIQHEGEVGWAWRQLLRLPLRIKIARVLDELGRREGDIEALVRARPGLWRRQRLHEGKLLHRMGPPPRLWPSTYHQKFATIDGRIAILGGLDIDERRWDTKRHAQAAQETWHDISVRVEGPAVADCCAHFRDLWNAEVPRYRAIAAEWMSGTDMKLTLDPLDRIDEAPAPVPPVENGAATVQMLRTRSRLRKSPFAFGPKPWVRELEAAHRRVIMSAERLLYIEAQFLRYKQAARWIAARARQRPDLDVIILLPNAPEEVAFDNDRNPAHRHGEWLQAGSLRYLRRKLGRRLGLFSLAKPAPLSDEERDENAPRGAAYGSGVIHVHAKLVIADAATCLVSSANINGRSFKWDTEFGMVWQDEGAIADFRARLWRQLLDIETAPESETALDVWRDIATHNASVKPAERRGFIVPHQIARARRFGRRFAFVPDDLV
jgi:phosphatidylserine/phosphatidylglycerophosphate/cardiolipin synthase-like enzyme